MGATKGVTLHECLQRQGLVGALLHDEDSYEAAAAEYEKSQATLPDDVDAFVQKVDNEIRYPTCGDEPFRGHAERLIAIVREMGAANASLRAERDGALMHLGGYLMFSPPKELLEENKAICERLARLEALGSWLESSRLAQLKWADETDQRGDVNRHEQRIAFEARADAFKRAGYELSNRAGRDLRVVDAQKSEPPTTEQPKPSADEDIGSCAWWQRNYGEKVKTLPKCCDRAGQVNQYMPGVYAFHCPVRCACHG